MMDVVCMYSALYSVSTLHLVHYGLQSVIDTNVLQKVIGIVPSSVHFMNCFKILLWAKDTI